jgi:hypothetical protein
MAVRAQSLQGRCTMHLYEFRHLEPTFSAVKFIDPTCNTTSAGRIQHGGRNMSPPMRRNISILNISFKHLVQAPPGTRSGNSRIREPSDLNISEIDSCMEAHFLLFKQTSSRPYRHKVVPDGMETQFTEIRALPSAPDGVRHERPVNHKTEKRVASRGTWTVPDRQFQRSGHVRISSL